MSKNIVDYNLENPANSFTKWKKVSKKTYWMSTLNKTKKSIPMFSSRPKLPNSCR